MFIFSWWHISMPVWIAIIQRIKELSEWECFATMFLNLVGVKNFPEEDTY